MYTILRSLTIMVLTIIFFTPVSAQDLSLVGFWSFDDSTGIDSSIYANNGTFSGNPVFIEGAKGSAIYFEGDDEMVISDKNSLDTDSSMTISLWIMPDSVTPKGAKVMCKWYSAPEQGDWLLTLSSKDSCGGDCVAWGFWFANYGVYGQNEGYFPIWPPSVDHYLKLGEWNFITVSFDTGLVKLYYDGDLIKTDTSLIKYTSLGEYGTDDIHVGKYWKSRPGYKFYGGLDEIRIYNRPLSESEVKNLYDYVTAIDNTADSIYLSADIELLQNYPNPFNSSTIIGYKLSVASNIELSIYNILGEKAATLVSEKQPPGFYQVEWEASQMASGIYFYQLTTDYGYTYTKKLFLCK